MFDIGYTLILVIEPAPIPLDTFKRSSQLNYSYKNGTGTPLHYVYV